MLNVSAGRCDQKSPVGPFRKRCRKVTAMTTFKAARTIQALSKHGVSNLRLQKLLYLSHMMHIGRIGRPLVSNPFEAWDYGPVEPMLYHKVKAYGSGVIPNIFSSDGYAAGELEFDSIKYVMDQVGEAHARQLVAITHWSGGAWAKHYSPSVRGVKIPDSDVLEEYKKLVERSKK